jgi:putative flippase GtrA
LHFFAKAALVTRAECGVQRRGRRGEGGRSAASQRHPVFWSVRARLNLGSKGEFERAATGETAARLGSRQVGSWLLTSAIHGNRVMMSSGLAVRRAAQPLRRRQNWVELGKFCTVGSSGYLVNLGVYIALLHAADVHYVLAASCSFAVAVTNNYTWNRHWTFRGYRGHLYYQGLRFILVSLFALGVNLAALHTLVALGLGKVPAQALAIVLVTPLNFVGNKIWSFRR